MRSSWMGFYTRTARLVAWIGTKESFPVSRPPPSLSVSLTHCQRGRETADGPDRIGHGVAWCC